MATEVLEYPVFTDADLAEYKDRAMRLGRQQTLALIARLEAAEAFMQVPGRELNYREIGEWQAWRKVAGK